jgi:hypothetical protein
MGNIHRSAFAIIQYNGLWDDAVFVTQNIKRSHTNIVSWVLEQLTAETKQSNRVSQQKQRTWGSACNSKHFDKQNR